MPARLTKSNDISDCDRGAADQARIFAKRAKSSTTKLPLKVASRPDR
jgi:hypothetical protein